MWLVFGSGRRGFEWYRRWCGFVEGWFLASVRQTIADIGTSTDEWLGEEWQNEDIFLLIGSNFLFLIAKTLGLHKATPTCNKASFRLNRLFCISSKSTNLPQNQVGVNLFDKQDNATIKILLCWPRSQTGQTFCQFSNRAVIFMIVFPQPIHTYHSVLRCHGDFSLVWREIRVESSKTFTRNPSQKLKFWVIVNTDYSRRWIEGMAKRNR